MKKCLIFYGFHKEWHKFYSQPSLKENFKNIVSEIKIILTLHNLKVFLNGDGKNYKNYILPTLVEHIKELREEGINTLFYVETRFLDMLADKKIFYDYVNNFNLLKYVPTNYSKESNRKTDKLVIIKPRLSCYSYGVYKKKICDLQDEEFDDNVVQEYIKERKEYAGYFVSFFGKVRIAFAYAGDYGDNEYIKCEGCSFDSTPKVRVNLMKNRQFISKIEEFLKPCNFTGTSCFDFKIKDKELKVFEINPRLGGSLKLEENRNDFIIIVKELMDMYDERNVYN